MRALTALLAPLALALALAGCGFSPMYAAPGHGQGPAIGAVDIGEIEGKAGHTLRTELDRLLSIESGQGPVQHLDITLREEVVPLGLRLDESASRAELRLRADYVFAPTGGREMRGSVLTVVSYEIPLAAFAAIAAQDDARERAAETLAERMRSELALRLAQSRRS
ncbi:MAG: LPS assembly lipoprotein LptE [Hyphomonadaceae bacterium]